jgi:hypothetical protein
MRCPRCHNELYAEKSNLLTCVCGVAIPLFDKKPQEAYQTFLFRIREYNPERISMDLHIARVRQEIADLRLKKHPTSKDVNRMVALVAYDNAYVEAKVVLRQMELVHKRLENKFMQMEYLEKDLGYETGNSD